MMWGKAQFAEAAEKILKASHLPQAKALGQSAIRGFDEETWVASRVEV